MNNQILSKKDVADMFGVHPNSVRNWEKNGALPTPVRLGRRVYWRREDIESLITPTASG